MSSTPNPPPGATSGAAPINPPPQSQSQSLTTYLTHHLASPRRSALRTSVLPALLNSIAQIATLLHEAHTVSQVGSANAFGDEQLNVDVLAEEAVRAALAGCPAVVTASSEEDPVERATRPSSPVHGAGDGETTTTGPTSGSAGGHGQRRDVSGEAEDEDGDEAYTVAFDPLDGSSIIGANWTIGTIVGIWDGRSALGQKPATRQVGAVLGVCGPRTSAIVALRLPGQERGVCFEVGLGGSSGGDWKESDGDDMVILRPDIKLQSTPPFKTRYFAPANLRAAAEDPRYLELVNHYIKNKYTLRYSGGLVPDVVHALVKGHGVYISPVTGSSKPKLRKLFELFPVALVVECAGGKAVDPVTGEEVLAKSVKDVEEKGGLICGTAQEVDFAVKALVR